MTYDTSSLFVPYGIKVGSSHAVVSQHSTPQVLQDDGTNNAVPASSLTPVTTSSLLFDTNLAVDGGCDPNGCTASNTQVGWRFSWWIDVLRGVRLLIAG